MDVLVQLPLSEEQRARLEGAAPAARFSYVKPRNVTREQVEAADAIVGNVPTGMLAGARHLRLLQLNSAGYEQYAAPGVLPERCALCCATDAYGQAVSEHLFAMVLSMVKRLPAYRDRQRAHDWCDLGPVTTLRGAHVLVLGAGDIGTHLAGLFAAMGSSVCGVRSREAAPHHPFDDMGTLSDLPRLLPQADVVCSVLPSTPQTAGIADQAFFDAMRDGAYFATPAAGTSWTSGRSWRPSPRATFPERRWTSARPSPSLRKACSGTRPTCCSRPTSRASSTWPSRSTTSWE